MNCSKNDLTPSMMVGPPFLPPPFPPPFPFPFPAAFPPFFGGIFFSLSLQRLQKDSRHGILWTKHTCLPHLSTSRGFNRKDQTFFRKPGCRLRSRVDKQLRSSGSGGDPVSGIDINVRAYWGRGELSGSINSEWPNFWDLSRILLTQKMPN